MACRAEPWIRPLQVNTQGPQDLEALPDHPLMPYF